FGQKTRLQEIRVEIPHAPLVFDATLLDKAAQREAFEKDARLRCREVPPIICPAAAPHGAEQPADGSAVVPSRSDAAQPAGEASAGRLLPGHPIYEENNV